MLREMTQDDMAAVLSIEQAVQVYPWTQGNFADALESGYAFLVAEAENAGICGYAILMAAADEAELLNIGVSANQQRQGVGRTLLLEMLNIARALQVNRVFLEVCSSNNAALALYSSAGFSQIGVRRNYYRNEDCNDDAITMACKLTDECHE